MRYERNSKKPLKRTKLILTDDRNHATECFTDLIKNGIPESSVCFDFQTVKCGVKAQPWHCDGLVVCYDRNECHDLLLCPAEGPADRRIKRLSCFPLLQPERSKKNLPAISGQEIVCAYLHIALNITCFCGGVKALMYFINLCIVFGFNSLSSMALNTFLNRRKDFGSLSHSSSGRFIIEVFQ